MTTKSPSLPSRGRTRSPARDIPKQQSAAPIRLKTVVRRLPPNLPESVFWQSVQPWVTDETASWKFFCQGKLRKKLNKENIPSRAYVLFKQEDHLTTFSREYDGHVFRDKQGNESQAVVEYAPNQKTPPEKKKVDSRHATIQQDEDYLSFITSLQNPSPTKPAEVDVDALLASTLPPEEPKSTPLLAALREQKQSAQEKRLVTSETAKSHSRKVGAAAAPVQKQEVADPALTTGRKGKKGKAPQASGTPSLQPSAPAAANPTSVRPINGGGRNRTNAGQASGPSTSSSAVSPAAVPAGKEAAVPPDGEQTQRRNRPMLGLQSRHLKAALSGAGMQVPPATPMSPSLPSPASTTPTSNTNTGAAAGPSGSAPRGPRGRGAGEKRSHEQQNKDSAPKDPGGGGRGSGKEKARSRHAPGQTHPGTVSRTANATPRILSRQDPPPLVVNELPPKDWAPTSGEAGGSRGRGGRRGRGQP